VAEQVINGLTIGSAYALVALGYTLVLGVLRLLNLAHGEIFMLGGFAGAVLLVAGLPLPLAILAVALGTGVLGLIVQRICFRTTSGEHDLMPILATVIVAGIADDLAIKTWGADPYNVPVQFGQAGIGPPQFHLSAIQGIILGLALALMLALDFLVRSTPLGRSMRAVAESPRDASLSGIDTRLVVTSTFFVSSLLAGIAGLLVALKTGVASVEVGLAFGLKALAVMAVGGLGNLRGAMLAGVLLGLIETLSFQFGLGGFSDLIVWAALVLSLILRPGGLMSAPAAQPG